jgi:hypothetical protein
MNEEIEPQPEIIDDSASVTLLPASRESPDYFINTAPEMDALERAAADGKHGLNYQQVTYPGEGILHSIPGASHSVFLQLTPEEALSGLTTSILGTFVSEQDADAALAFLYIARLLAPPMANLPQDYSGAWVDVDDVISKIGWAARNAEHRLELRRRVYQFLLFGARAEVVGARRSTYKDRQTGEVIDTVIQSALWHIHDRELPAQKSLFPTSEIPVRVEVVISRQWAKLLTSPQTAQYLPMGEILGAIPGSKASGAWARVVGLALASFWRRNPRESTAGTLKPTRRELLERYPPKTGTVEAILSSTKPIRAVEYWCGAMAILVETGLLENVGEAVVSFEDQKARMPRQGWADGWLNELVDLRPGPLLKDAVAGRVAALPVAPVRRKRGRPKKSV